MRFPRIFGNWGHLKIPEIRRSDHQFTLGGIRELSGYANERFRGNQVALGGPIYYPRNGS